MTREEIKENITKEIMCKSIPGEECGSRRCFDCEYYISSQTMIRTLISALDYINKGGK